MTRRSEHHPFKPMKPLHVIAATSASVLCALGLSVGAAMAEGTSHAAAAKTGTTAPSLLCDLHDPAR